jgi:hypothetical protein
MSDIDFDRENSVAQIKMEEAQRAHDRHAELHRTYFEAASKSAEVAVKTSVLVNGGAAVAVLALMGGMLGKDILTVRQVADVSSSLMWFACGVGAGITALAFIYLMNYSAAARTRWQIRVYEAPFVQDTPQSWYMRHVYTIAHTIAVAVAVISVGLFIYGVLDVRDSIARLAKVVPSPPSIQAPKGP